VSVVDVNCDEHRELCQKFDVRGYPTLFYVPKGGNKDNSENYNGARTAEAMQTFIESKL
jgi:protein disulfide-isomerase A6